MRSLHLLMIPLLAFALMSLTGCNEAQIARAEEAVSRADAMLDQCKVALAAANEGLHAAQVLADATHSVEASAAVSRANVVLQNLKDTMPTLEAIDKEAHAAVTAAKDSQGNGATSLQIVAALVSAVLGTGLTTGIIKGRATSVATAALGIVGQFSRVAAVTESDDGVAAARTQALKVADEHSPAVLALVAKHVTV